MTVNLETLPTLDETTLKVLLVGDSCTGKTCIAQRFVYDRFTTQYRTTIGVDFLMKLDGRKVSVQLWDMAGQERFGSMCRVYCKGASAVIIVYDVHQEKTFQGALRWKQQLDEYLSPGVPVILLANKLDLLEGEPDTTVLDKVLQEHKINAWFYTSAKDNTNIQESVTYLVKAALAAAKERQTSDPRTVQLHYPAGTNQHPSGSKKTDRCNQKCC